LTVAAKTLGIFRELLVKLEKVGMCCE